MDFKSLTEQQILDKAETVCGLKHAITGKRWRLNGFLDVYTGIIEDDGIEWNTEWNQSGRCEHTQCIKMAAYPAKLDLVIKEIFPELVNQ